MSETIVRARFEPITYALPNGRTVTMSEAGEADMDDLKAVYYAAYGAFEVNRGNMFSNTWQGPMIQYYQEIERTAKTAFAVFEKMNQKYDEYLQGS
mgnify:CR=1 FL=1